MNRPSLTKEESAQYMQIVQGGNMDNMFDFAYQLGRDNLLKELSITRDMPLAEWKGAFERGKREMKESILAIVKEWYEIDESNRSVLGNLSDKIKKL